MPKTKPPYPEAFKQKIVELAMTGRTPAELSREFEVSAQSITAWVARAAADAGKPLRGHGRVDECRARRTGAIATPCATARAGARHPGKGYGLVRGQGRQDVQRVYELVNANRAEANVRTMCRVLGVSASGYYAWRERVPSATALANAVLTVEGEKRT